MKFKTTQSLRTLCLAPLTVLCLLSAAQAQTPATPAPSMSMQKGNMQKGMTGSGDMKESMKMGMDDMQKMQMSGDPDKDFAMMMKIHHEQGVKMAKMELANGKSPEMKSMAKNIISAQNKEIAKFERWLAKQK